MKTGDLVRVNTEKLEKNGRPVLKSEKDNPIGIIVRKQYAQHTRKTSYRVLFTDSGSSHWYSKIYLEVISENW